MANTNRIPLNLRPGRLHDLISVTIDVKECVRQNVDWIKALLDRATGDNCIDINKIFVPNNIAEDDRKDIQKLVEAGMPFYHAIIACVYHQIWDKFPVKTDFVPYDLAEMSKFLLYDVAMIAIQGVNITRAPSFTPAIIKRFYNVIWNMPDMKKYLYGDCADDFNAQDFLQLADVLIEGKIGSRLGLGNSGTRYIQAMTNMYFPTVQHEPEVNAISILRAIAKSGLNKEFHSLRRRTEFTKVFGSINHVVGFFFQNFCDPAYKRKLIEMKSVFSGFTYGSQFTAYTKWNVDEVAAYVYDGQEDAVVKKGAFKELVTAERGRVNERPFLLIENDAVMVTQQLDDAILDMANLNRELEEE